MLPMLFATMLFAQADLERVFHFTHTKSAQNIQEVASAVRTITEMREVSADVSQKTLTFRGSAGEGSLADWLLANLDVEAAPAQDPAVFAADLAEDPEKAVRLFYFRHLKSVQDVHQLATLVRTIADIRRLMTYSGLPAMTIRTTPSQVTLVEWLVAKLDQPMSSSVVLGEYPLEANDVVRLFYLASAETPQQLNEASFEVRQRTQARRIFVHHASRVLAIRGTPAQVAQAAQLIAAGSPQ